MRLAVVAATVVCAASGTARAQEPQPESRSSSLFDPSYLIDGGALPFFGAIKVLVVRHRPDWGTDGYDTPGAHRAFLSGHATQAFGIATYSILFLRQHVFAAYRGSSRLPWWEGATYAGIALGASALAGERVLHSRHHLSDVVIGGTLGTATSTLFYLYQEGRYRDHERRVSPKKSLSITPSIGGRGATVGISGTF